MNSLIDIIIPIYNVELYLSRCLDELFGQFLSDFRLILVDDGSYDETEEEIPDFAFDYHVPKDADDKNRSDLKKVSNNPAKTSKVKAVNKSINMKNTGNPLIVLALSILGLFVVQSRRKN